MIYLYACSIHFLYSFIPKENKCINAKSFAVWMDLTQSKNSQCYFIADIILVLRVGTFVLNSRLHKNHIVWSLIFVFSLIVFIGGVDFTTLIKYRCDAMSLMNRSERFLRINQIEQSDWQLLRNFTNNPFVLIGKRNGNQFRFHGVMLDSSNLKIGIRELEMLAHSCKGLGNFVFFFFLAGPNLFHSLKC